MANVRRVFTTAFAVTVFLSSMVGAETLDEQLWKTEELRKGRDTPFEEVEKICQSLLQEYTTPEEHGRIYYQLAHVYAQSGLVKPDKTIQYAEKALGYPLESVKRLRLYLYWGDAIQVTHAGVRGKQLVAARKEAVMPYLMGLKETLGHGLSEKRPELPVLVDRQRYSGPPDTEEYHKARRMVEQQVQARKLAKQQYHMFELRDSLTNQTAYLYSRFPFASNEIEQLARKMLEDEAAVERLMKAVKEAVHKSMKSAGWEPKLLPGDPDAWATTVPVEQTQPTIAGVTEPTPRPTPLQAKEQAQASADQQSEPQRSWRYWITVTVVAVVGLLVTAVVLSKKATGSVR